MKCLGHISFKNYILNHRNEAYFRAITFFFFFLHCGIIKNNNYMVYISITVMKKRTQYSNENHHV